MLAGISVSCFFLWQFEIGFWFHFFKFLLLMLTLCFFIRQLWLLRFWHRHFTLSSKGEGILHLGDRYNIDFFVLPNCRVTPIFVILRYQYINKNGKSKFGVLPIFFDMLSSKDYRCLCRISSDFCQSI